jgi:ATPase subunit of ABC transporter with duplicated ATPase domains
VRARSGACCSRPRGRWSPTRRRVDEPTDHLDVDTIERLEGLLREWRGTLVFVTHDRAFLRRLATRILDLDRGRLRSYDSGYDAYSVTREHRGGGRGRSGRAVR